MKKIKFNIAEWEEKLKNGADINQPDAEGWTALYYAIWAGSIRGIKFCVKQGADVNYVYNEVWRPLTLACDGWAIEKSDIARVLVKLGADVNVRGPFDSTPLISAAVWCDYETIKALIDAGADVKAKNKFGNTALHEAAEYNEDPNIIKLLLDVGADVNAKNNDGKTPLMEACWGNKNTEVVQTLLDSGVDIFAKDNEGDTCFYYAAWSNYEVLKFLLMRIEDINTRKKYGYNLIKYDKQVTERVATLLECGIDIRESEEFSKSMFQHCVYNPHKIKDFVKYGIKFNISPDVLLSALSSKRREADLVKLLAVVADINVRDENQNTVLFDFIKHNNFRIVNMLIDAGADVNAKNNQGETPLSYAVKYKAKDKIFGKLLAGGANVETEDNMVKSAVAAFWKRQKIEPSVTQLRLFKEKKG